MSQTVRGRRSGRPPFLAVDVTGSLHIVGTLVAYLSVATLVPAAVALGYDESPWPFVLAKDITGFVPYPDGMIRLKGVTDPD